MTAAFDTLTGDSSPFALTTALVAGREKTVFRHAAKNLPEIYRKAFRARNAPFLLTDSGIVTLEDLFGRAGACAKLLESRQIGKGIRVAIGLSDDNDWMAAFLAVTSVGATAVLTSPLEQTSQAAMAGCAAAIQDEPGEHATTIDASMLAPLRHQHVPLPQCDIDPEQEACIAFTSGSTGKPKGAILTHRGLVTGLMNMMLAGAFAARGGSPRVARPNTPAALLRTSLQHVSGYMQMLLMLMVGGRLVRSDRTDIRQLVGDHQVTAIIGISDEEILALLDAPSEEALHPLRSVTIVGRKLSDPIRRRIRQKLPNLGLGAGYGLTETNGLVCAIGNVELDRRPHTAGPPLPTVACRIVRKGGDVCAPGESGEIQLGGAMMMRSYCNAKEPAGSWFATGDIGFLSDDGYLHIIDKKDRFLCDEDRYISCREIEEAAREAAGSLNVAALTVDNCQGGQLVIVAEPGIRDFSAIRASLAQQFPAQIIGQARFVVMEQLPRTVSGKIAYSRLLKEPALFP